MTAADPATAVAPIAQHAVEVFGYEAVLRRHGEGRSVLFLHDAFFPTRWTAFHDTLAASCDLLAPIHPGYAEGGPPSWMRGFDDVVLHYRGLLDELDVTRVDLVGYGLGGWVAAHVAAFFPERIRSFTVIAPMGLWIPEAPMFEFLGAAPARRVAALFNGDTEGHESLLSDPDDIDAFVEGYGEDGVTARLIWSQRYDVGLARRVAMIDRPSLVIAPGEDRIVPDEHARRWAELLPSGRLVTVDGTGHALVVQAPERVVAELSAFFEEVPA